MKTMKKTNLILAAVLVILLGLAVLYRGPFKRWQEASGQPKNFLAELEADKLDKAELGAPVRLTLTKEAAGWQVDDGKLKAPASPALVEELLSQLKAAQQGKLELVSTREERQAEFETGQSGFVVKLYQGGKKTELVIGKMTSDYAGSYLGRPGDPNTYRPAAINLASLFKIEEWRDTAIFREGDASKIAKLRLQFPSKQHFLEKRGEDWYEGATKLDRNKVQPIVDRLAVLSAVKIPAQDFAPTGLAKSRLIIQATGEGIDRTLMLGQADKDGLVYAKTASSDLIYLIDKADYQVLERTPDRLR